MHSPSALIGRDRELAQAQQLLAAAKQGTGRLLLVGGEAGIGKSAFVHALAHTSQQPLWGGRCPGLGETPTFGPWLDLLQDLSREVNLPLASLPHPFGEARGEWAPPEIARAITDWVKRAARPLLLVLEDIHWADTASLELLRQAVPRLLHLPVLLMATYRSEEIHRAHPLWRILHELDRLGTSRTVLGRLTTGDLEHLVMRTMPDLRDSRPLAVQLAERTGGHPLFARELLARVDSEGRLPAEIPETIYQAIDRKLVQINQTGTMVLQAAATIGEQVSYDLLASVVDQGDEELSAALGDALALRLIRADGPEGDHFVFDHALIREAVMSHMLLPRRRHWHRRIADALLTLPNPDDETVALHLHRANDPRASDYLRYAGDAALRAGARTQARQHYQQAVSLLAPSDYRCGELLLKLGMTWQLSDPNQARRYMNQSLQSASESGDLAVATWAEYLGIVNRFADFLYGADRPFDALRRLRDQQETLLHEPRYRQLETDLLGSCAGYPRVINSLARALAYNGDVQEARRLIDETRGRLPPGDEGLGLLLAETDLAMHAGQVQQVIAIKRKLMETDLNANLTGGSANWAWYLLQYHLLYGGADAAEVDRVALQAQLLQEQALRRGGSSFMHGFSVLGYYQFLRGDWDGARRNLVEYLHHNPNEARPELWLSAAQLEVEQGNLSAAWSLLSVVQSRPPDQEPRICIPTVVAFYCWQARVLVGMGNSEEADRYLDAADRLLKKQFSQCDAPLVCRVRAEVAVSRGDRTRARREAEAGLARAKTVNDALSAIALHRLSGELEAWEGNTDAAQSQFEAALDRAERCRFPYEVALTHMARARAFPQERTWVPALESALELFARLQARPAEHVAVKLLASGNGASGQAKLGTANHPFGVTDRQLEILRLVAEGLTDREIAGRLFLSNKTVEGHLRNLYNRFNVNNRTALVVAASRQGLIS